MVFLLTNFLGFIYVGSEYENIVEIFHHLICRKFEFDTSLCYFDCCTNFYFELDKRALFSRRSRQRKTGSLQPLDWVYCLM